MNLRDSLGVARRVTLSAIPYALVAFAPQLAHPVMAAVGGAGALPGITQGANTMQGSFIQAAGAVGIGGMAWGATHLVHRPDDWVGGITRIGAGGACSYVATQAQPVSTQFGAGVIF
jgi:hypothetical protein